VDKVIAGGKQFSKAAKGISPAEEYYIGRAVAANILSRYPLLDNSSVTDYVNKVGLTVAAVSERPYTYGGYHFAVLNTDATNAFACPGGIVFITKGLLELTKNEDELAGVLAHEVAHVAHNDGISAIKKSRWTKLGVDTAMAAGSHFAPGDVKALTDAFSGVVGDVTKKVLNNQYGRKAEKKADASALGYMHEAGYDPNALVALLKQQKSRGMGKGSYLSMHAKPGKRIAWLEHDVKKNGWSGNIASTRTSRFEKMIAKVR
jgi:predicted Zn-dependent protease